MNTNQNDRCLRPFRRRWPTPSWTLVTVLSLAAMLSPMPAHAGADAARGKQIYDRRCLGCHGDGKAPGSIGPSLAGIVGRKAASGESGVHSRALIGSDIVWNDASLRKFLAAPTKAVPGTNMPVGVPDAQQIEDLVAYLHTLR